MNGHINGKKKIGYPLSVLFLTALQIWGLQPEVWLYSVAWSDLATVVKDKSGSFMILSFATIHVFPSFLFAAP